MRLLLAVIFPTLFFLSAKPQSCSCISGIPDKNSGKNERGGIVSSKEFYSLLIDKTTVWAFPSLPPVYTLILTAASDVFLPDNLTATTGTFEVNLSDGSTVVWSGAHCSNEPFGMKGTVGFRVDVSESQILILSKSQISTLNAFGIITATFSVNSQKKQKKIVDCLLKN
ncbi:MAG TPA: hypothetical protein VMC08_05245 [Bacteroidales bacterium]|nr:hypothetical protein [Bacteroidales bacterium]